MAEEFRAFLERNAATIEDLPAGTFTASGTNVNACLVAFDAQPRWP